ncbi:MAG TPA: right-handed parallel beta-helix repeat-containing protein, partial [Pirellulaceae bacterium]|nr:right-handed parallel beta-helix repeat-containing protein [Pirellulaceae bacterium]
MFEGGKQSLTVQNNDTQGVALVRAGSHALFVGGSYSFNHDTGIALTRVDGDLSLDSVVALANGGDGLLAWPDGQSTVAGQISVNNSQFSYNAGSGFFIHEAGSTGAKIVDSQFNKNGDTNLILRYVNGVVDFDHVSAIGSQSGFGAALHLSTSGQFHDTDGEYGANAQSGLHLFDVGDVTLTRTTADGNGGRGVEADQGIKGELVADGVRLRKNGGAGMWVTAASSIEFHDAPAFATEVTGNGGNGLFVGDGGSHATITGGSFSYNVGDNVRIGIVDDAVTIAGATLDGSVAGNGLNLLSAGSLSISDSEFSNNFNDGIQFEKLLGDLSLTSVVADGNGGSGAYTWADNNMAVGGQISVVDTQMNANGGSGLFLHGLGGAGTSIAGSTFDFNHDSNLVLRYAKGLVDFNQVSAVGSQTGYGAALHLTTNGQFHDTYGYYSQNQMAGVHLYDTGNVTLNRTIADANGGRGVEAEDGIAGALVADGVRLRNNGSDGMWVAIADSVEFHNAPGDATEVTGNAGQGLYVINGGSHVTLSGGSFSSNGGDNVHLIHATGPVTLSNVKLDGSVAGNGLNLLSAGSL